MGRLFDYVQVIKHNRFIKTGEPLAGAICYSLTTAIPLSTMHRNKSGGPLEVPVRGSGSAWKRTPLIKALLNLSVSVRYWRAITPELLLLFSTLSLCPSPSFTPL